MRWLFAVLAFASCGDDTKVALDAAPIDAAVDAPIDTPANPCAACGPSEICVARYDGACTRGVSCVAATVSCPDNACTADCQAAYCPEPYQCATRPPCGDEPEGAFTCYGP